jgi:L-threonylcarbamoyladenylate synthase
MGIISNSFNEAKQRLSSGEAIILPTETVYGIAVDATNNSAIERIYEVKGRKRDVPLQLVCGSFEQALQYGDFNNSAQKLAKKFFPGAITIIVKRHINTAIAENINTLNDTIGIRVPNHPLLLEFLQYLETPLAMSSANISGQPAQAEFNDALQNLSAKGVQFGIDGGKCQFGIGSTVVDATDEANIKILREGGIPAAEILKCLGGQFSA